MFQMLNSEFFLVVFYDGWEELIDNMRRKTV